MKKINIYRNAFTLLELLTVMMIIGILAALVLKGAGYANWKAATSRATGEIAAISTGLESYKADMGEYVDTEATRISPTADADNTKYKASIAILSAFIGGGQAVAPSETSDSTEVKAGANHLRRWKVYAEMPGSSWSTDSVTITLPNIHKQADSEPDSFQAKVRYLIDPFGNPYGYSSSQTNNPTFDLWSYAGDAKKKEKWIVNW